LVSTAKVATGYDQEDIEVRFHILGMPG